MNDEVNVNALKGLGNEAVRNEKYEEAILHYTHALKREPSDHTLYSNRSLAFLKIKQYYFAMEDAKETIKLNPNWAKGYFRRAEVEFATYQFSKALDSYKVALEYQPDDHVIINSISRTIKEEQREKWVEARIPWVGAGVGIVIGVIIVIADYLYTKSPTLTHPLLMALMTMAIAMTGFGIAKLSRYYVRCQREALLETPTNLVKDDVKSDEDTTENETSRSNHNKYTKSQARQRYKQGKS